MRTTEWTNALFLSLSKPNGTHKKRLWADVETFLRKLCEYTGVHIHAIRGFEDGYNSHEHALVAVPADELERFKKRLESFKPHRAWSWNHKVDAFDQSRELDAIRYVLVKHTPVEPEDSKEYFCPRRYNRCACGKCDKIPSP
jgi:hypothetical protein